jgi:REP element-mobilizing transposase RayT
VTAPRIIVEGATYAITRRCAFRKLFLTPLTPVVHQGVLYALALAQHKARVLLHGEVFMPNHAHLTVTPVEQNLPDFLRLLFGETGKFLKVALAENGFEPPERIWNPDRPHVMRVVNEGAQLTWLQYVAANPIKAGLVERIDEYPGHVTSPGLLQNGRVVVKRPPFYFDERTCPEELELKYSAPPLLKRAFGSAEPIVHHLRRALTDTERACRRRGSPVLGAMRITRQHPWAEPRSPRTFREGPTPCFMVTGSDELRVQCAMEAVDFRRRHADSRKAMREGGDPEFPYGSFAVRVLYGARVEPVTCLEGAVLCAPGKLDFDDPPMPTEDLHALVTELRKVAAHAEPDGDTLAERILEGAADQVDRRAATAPAKMVQPEDGEGKAAPAETKRVVLRDSTRAARERREEKANAREHAGPHEPDVDPPPD